MLQLPTRNGHRLLSNNNGTFNKTVVATDCFAVTAVLKFRTKRAHEHSSDFSRISHTYFLYHMVLIVNNLSNYV